MGARFSRWESRERRFTRVAELWEEWVANARGGSFPLWLHRKIAGRDLFPADI